MNADELKLTRAKTAIVLEHPFFSSLLFSLTFEDVTNMTDASMDGMSTDGKSIKFNYHFIRRMSEVKVMGTIVHCLFHILHFHHLRRNGREDKRWQAACDLAINPILIKMGFKLPDGFFWDERYEGKSSEEIYELLPHSDKEMLGFNFGNVSDGASNMTAEFIKNEEQRITEEYVSAKMAAKMCGTRVGEEEMIRFPGIKGTVDWRSLLGQFMSRSINDDYSFSSQNRRHTGGDFILPSLRKKEGIKMGLVVDTSSSMDANLLKIVLGEIGFLQALINATIIFLGCSTTVSFLGEVMPTDPMPVVRSKRGGTDYAPAFKFLVSRNDDLDCILYFTDGICSSFGKDPNIPVLWMTYGGMAHKFRPPFGQKIIINNNK